MIYVATSTDSEKNFETPFHELQGLQGLLLFWNNNI